jgi:hypothetical protein
VTPTAFRFYPHLNSDYESFTKFLNNHNMKTPAHFPLPAFINHFPARWLALPVLLLTLVAVGQPGFAQAPNLKERRVAKFDTTIKNLYRNPDSTRRPSKAPKGEAVTSPEAATIPEDATPLRTCLSFVWTG